MLDALYLSFGLAKLPSRMLIGFDTSPCILSLRNRSMSNYEMSKRNVRTSNVFCTKINFDLDSFFPIRFSNSNRGYGKQGRFYRQSTRII